MNVIEPSARAKVLMIERGIKPRDIASGTGLTVNYIYRLLNGLVVSSSGRRKIEAFLGQPIWPKANSAFANTPTDLPNPTMRENSRFPTGTSDDSAALSKPSPWDPVWENFDKSWLHSVSKSGLTALCIQFKPCPAGFESAEFIAGLEADFASNRLGCFHSSQWQNQILHFFYAKTKRLSEALQFVNLKLEKHDLLGISAVGYWDEEAELWRTFYPGTAPQAP